MKKTVTLILITLAFCNYTNAQNLFQTIRGTVTNIDSKIPLEKAQVYLSANGKSISVFTSQKGTFRFDSVKIGRVNLQVFLEYYETKFISNVVVNSGKEVVLNIELKKAFKQLKKVVLKAKKAKGAAENSMVLISSRSISPEQTSRFAGGFNDPSRITSNFAGVTATQDGSNDIIIRGNAPKYVQWRLEGLQITNPNHFADQAAVGGAISALNNNLLDKSDFHTGAFTAEFGDALSGVYDVKLRKGNNEKFESVFAFGLLGTDITLEGPFKKGYDGSFIANYRYSTVSLVGDLGLVDIGGTPKFQDGAFKLFLPTKKAGNFSIFGLGGLSSFTFEDVKPSLWVTPGNNSMQSNIKENFEKETHLLNLGITNEYSINKHSFLKTSISFSSEGIEDQVFENKFIKIFDNQGTFIKDSSVSNTLNFYNKVKKSTYRGAVTYTNRINNRNKIQVGTKYALFDDQNAQSNIDFLSGQRVALVDYDENISTLRNFVSWKHRASKKLMLVYGLHNMNVLQNSKSSLENRLAVRYKASPKSTINFGYGKHSTMESSHHYFTKITQNGVETEPNKDLDLLKAHHFIAGYENRLSINHLLKLEVYYQHLYNLPVANSDSNIFATVNEGLEFNYVDLVNEGTGRNYGVEVTLEKFFHNNFYYLLNASVFRSKYTALDGVERNTQYDGNYLVNFLVGKEFTNWGKKKNQTLGINGKIFFAGGRKILPILRDQQNNVAVDPANNQFWDYDKAYQNKIEDIYSIILSASYKWNKPKATHELFLNLDNVTNSKGKLTEFYDENEPNKIGYVAQFGLFPNLMYRVYF